MQNLIVEYWLQKNKRKDGAPIKDPAMFIKLINGSFLCLTAVTVMWSLMNIRDGKTENFTPENVVRKSSTVTMCRINHE
jgi:hypothetical protein